LNEDAEANCPEMKGAIQSMAGWNQIPFEKALIQSAFQGIGMAMSFSFIVLMIVTRNPITSVVSIFNVTIIILSVMTFMVWNGQQFGTDQSISLVMLIGFAVDYVLHLSTDYMHSAGETRNDKMRQAYREMGVSIFSGCVTTFGCGFWLLFANF